MIKKNLILASGSPRRQNLLKEMGFDFKVILKEVDEEYPKDMDVRKVAEFLANKKSQAYQLKDDNDVLITADSIVLYKNMILNKPDSREQAIFYLSMIDDDQHEVMTGVCLKSKSKTLSFSDITTVYIEPTSKAEIIHYVDAYKPFDKAGAYGVQEWFGHNKIHKIEGSYTNIMGLPTAKLYEELLRF